MHCRRSLDGIRSRQLVDGKRPGGGSIESADEVIGLGTQVDARNVLEMKDGPVRVRADHNIAKLLRRF